MSDDPRTIPTIEHGELLLPVFPEAAPSGEGDGEEPAESVSEPAKVMGGA